MSNVKTCSKGVALSQDTFGQIKIDRELKTIKRFTWLNCNKVSDNNFVWLFCILTISKKPKLCTRILVSQLVQQYLFNGCSQVYNNCASQAN